MEDGKFFNVDIATWQDYFTEKYDAKTASAFTEAIQRFERADKDSTIDGLLNAWIQFSQDIKDAGLSGDCKKNGFRLYDNILWRVQSERDQLKTDIPNLASAFVLRKNIGTVTAVLSQSSELCARLTFVEQNDPTKRVAIPPDTVLTEYFGNRVAPHRHRYDICLDQTFILRVGNELVRLPTIAFSDFY